MLVKFQCKACADVIMFGDIAIQLLKLMGHSGTIPSAIATADIPATIHRLESAIAAEPVPPANNVEASDNEENVNDVISLKNRALPLINLLNEATASKCDVIWDKL